MQPFATTAQYEARYGTPPDVYLLEEVLKDATREIAAALDRAGIPYVSPTPDYAEKLMQACRSMANRAVSSVSSDVPAGATQISQGAIGLSATYTLGNPYGEVYMSKSERRLLGIGGQKIVAVWPYGGADVSG
ncbi:MAG: hypothetical protein RR842_08155 [Gordonibacter sp.]|uniref:hypothetical protein n=1 Tax=Gordonibacter sp. TaxID=1968902 RepID=UPI002FCBBC1B